jgi:hypothetical protein
MKGRGADIFFAEDAAPAEAAVDPSLIKDLEQLPDEELLVFEAAVEALKRPADQQIGPRLAREDLEIIRDLAYEAHKTYGVKLTRQDVVRLGVSWLLANYEERKETSVLGLFLRSRRGMEGDDSE